MKKVTILDLHEVIRAIWALCECNRNFTFEQEFMTYKASGKIAITTTKNNHSKTAENSMIFSVFFSIYTGLVHIFFLYGYSSADAVNDYYIENDIAEFIVANIFVRVYIYIY